MPDDEFDARIARYLRWETAQVGGSPDRPDVATIVAAGSVHRSRASSPALVWAALLMALLIVAAAILVAGNPDPSLVVAPPTASPIASQVAGPCGAGRVQIQPATGGTISADAAAI